MGEAADWLSRVFGFRELLRQTTDGTIHHTDMDTGGGMVMLAKAGERLAVPKVGTRVSAQHIVWVDDVDEHYARTTAHNAKPLHKPRDKPWSLRQYLVHDYQGHLWEFTQHIREVPPSTNKPSETMGAGVPGGVWLERTPTSVMSVFAPICRLRRAVCGVRPGPVLVT